MEISLVVAVAEEHTITIGDNINSLSLLINKHFKQKEYGTGLLMIKIGFLVVKTTVGYEHWYLPKKPKYAEYFKGISVATNQVFEFEKVFWFEIKITDNLIEQMLNSSRSERFRILGKEIEYSLCLLDKLPKKVRDFDKAKFKNDVRLFFEDLTVAP